MTSQIELTCLRDLGYERSRHLFQRALTLVQDTRLCRAEPLLLRLPLPLRVLSALSAVDLSLRGLEAAIRLPADLRITFCGGDSPLARTWIEAAIYFPFELFMLVPQGRAPVSPGLTLALQAGAKIFLTHEADLAVEDAQLLCLAETPPVPLPELLALTSPGAPVLVWSDICPEEGAAAQPVAHIHGDELPPERHFPHSLLHQMEAAVLHAFRESPSGCGGR